MKHYLNGLFGRPRTAGQPAQPCTPNQERYLLASLGGSQSYYLPLTFDLPPNISVARLRRAVEQVVDEAPTLAVAFAHESGGRFSQYHVGRRALALRKVRVADDAAAVSNAMAFIHGGAGPLKEPPCKLHIAQLPAGRHLATLALHHAVADAVSLGLVVDAVSAAYVGDAVTMTASQPRAVAGFTPLDAAHWTAALSRAPDVGSLPLVRPARDGDSTVRDEVLTCLGTAGTAQLAAAAQAMGVTMFESCFAAYLVVLARQTGRPAACATFQSAGRHGHPEREGAIGVFSNALPVIAHFDKAVGFAENANAVRRSVRGALRHEAMPYHEIIRHTGVHPRFGINWYPGEEVLRIDGQNFSADRRVGWQSDFDLNLHAIRSSDGLRLSLSYPRARVPAWRARAVLDQLVDQLGCDARTGAIPLQDKRFASSIVPAPMLDVAYDVPDAALYAQVVQTARAHGNRSALVSVDRTLTYDALAHDVEVLAEALRTQGAGPGRAIAIELPRGPAVAVALLAADCVGSVFAVYDPDYPVLRRSAMDAALCPALRLRPARDGKRGQIVLASGDLDLEVTCLTHAQIPLPVAARYALFTSGTTGRPRCVLADGRGLHNFLSRARTDWGIGPGDRFALLGGLGHDPMLRDMLLPLISGATLHVPPEAARRDPRMLFDWLSKAAPTILHLTPQLARVATMAAGGRTLPALRRVVFGGDLLTREAITEFRTVAPSAVITNLYGSTETPQAASLYDVSAPTGRNAEDGAAHDWETCPVGQGAGRRRLTLICNGSQAVIGEPAEIVVEGPDLSMGYYDAADGLAPGTAMQEVRTGDLGMRMPSGDVLLLGRADDQVKIRGTRVEPAEITRHLVAHADVAQAVVVARPGVGGELELLAYAVPTSGAQPSAEELREDCRRSLPAAMVPRAVMILDRLPLTANGKVDQTALPSPDVLIEAVDATITDSSTRPNPKSTAATSPEAQALAKVVADALGRPSVDPAKRVRDLGVDSLSYLTVLMALEGRIGSLPADWDARPIHALAKQSASGPRAADGGRGSAWTRHVRMVETPILMRAISIAAVVAGHFGLIAFGGATSALFFIAGHSFGRFQVPAVLERDGVKPILSLVALIAVPTIFYLLLAQTVFGAFEPLTFLMLGNLLGPEFAKGLSFWFLDVLVQCLLVLSLFLAIPSVRRALRARPFECACLAVVVSVAGRYGLQSVWDTDPLYNRVVQDKIWLVALGWCLAQATVTRERVVATALALAVLGLDFWLGNLPPLLTALTFAVILAAPRAPIPKAAAIPLTRIAAASLFIYLTHFNFRSVADRLPGPLDTAPAAFVIALLGGIIVHLLWDKSIIVARRILKHINAESFWEIPRRRRTKF